MEKSYFHLISNENGNTLPRVRLALKFIAPLAAALFLIAWALVPMVESFMLSWFVRDLDIRSELITNALQAPLSRLADKDAPSRILNLFNATIKDERLYALGLCDAGGVLRVKTSTYPAGLPCGDARIQLQDGTFLLQDPVGTLHVASHVIHEPESGTVAGRLVLLHDMSFVERRSSATRKNLFYFFVGLGVVISFITVLIARLSVRDFLQGVRRLLQGEFRLQPLSQIKSRDLLPVAKDLRQLITELERERRVRDESQINWTPKALKKLLSEELAGEEILIVSNREPYIHVKKKGKIETQVPASGLVTALEPIMRACSGTWIAHGSGSADREMVDSHDHVRVPPDHPSYQIRRVWLTDEEERGYYYGFSNEGLWPLCHIAHTRPTFRSSDWKQYVDVNRKFAETVFEEARTENPVILVQDYHFALLPRMVRERLPEATIISFWHIPWPNPEAFGICPWREEILEGMLGSSILGFHTKFHCNNFIDAVDRFLEARINRENSTVSHGGKLTAIRSYPISIDWPPQWIGGYQKTVVDARVSVRAANSIAPPVKIGVGVDRLDYTKGILERFLAVERFLEIHPEWVGKFTFVQIAAPSRSTIEHYRLFSQEVTALTERINRRFSTGEWRPILLKAEHHEPQQVFEYYRAADLCMVTSLHDGMNLVAKEFVASRDDERGVLILSRFTGASRELPEALIVNPYDIDQCAEAIYQALSMPENEQRDRIRSMRSLIQEFNVYRWAGRMLIDASRIRHRQRFLERVRRNEPSPA
ncbi:MAG: trehalose-6-phosphate synthase [Bdellovibrionales bacterium]|nr:trehalose-6-phosphate synthase [Bdellovibrionales bacterium]